ncbi:MAG: pentapeptide repeat-containing protein, partial [Deltaproteobacteria bacterium]|nr:pentapeptide repeat-containing protein [Deltaproteobacteria bacterium]
MAKPEHLAKVEESVEDWNMWRYDNPEIVPAFWGADLEEADLREAKLRDADLKGANLMEANLKR